MQSSSKSTVLFFCICKYSSQLLYPQFKGKHVISHRANWSWTVKSLPESPLTMLLLHFLFRLNLTFFHHSSPKPEQHVQTVRVPLATAMVNSNLVSTITWMVSMSNKWKFQKTFLKIQLIVRSHFVFSLLTVNSDFVIDMGTYEPEVNNMLVTKVTKRPTCDPGTKLVFGIKVGFYGRSLSRQLNRLLVFPNDD